MEAQNISISGGVITPSFEKNLSYILLGQKGGKNRLQIIELLNERPYNLHQLAQVLNLNYRTIEHHMGVLAKHELITSSKSKVYGKIYYLSPEMESNIGILDEMKNKVEIHEKLMESTALPQFFQKIIEQTNDAVVITDKNFNILLWNRNAERVYGYNKKEILGSSAPLFADMTVKKNILKELEKGKGFKIIETQVKSKDGKIFYVELSANVIKAKKETLGYSFFIRDISKRKNAEQKSQEALEYAESIVNTVREPLIVLDEDLRIVSANQSFYQVFKVSPKELEKKYIYEMGNHQWDIPELRKLLEAIIPKKTTIENFEVESDFEHIGKRVMVLNARMLHRETDQINMILLAIEDITGQRMANEGLAAIFYLSPDLICISDGDHFQRVNPSWEKRMGWKSEELLSKPITDLIHPEDIESTKNTLAKLDKRDVVYFENRYRKKDGEYRWLSWSASKWLHGLTYGIARDITDFKEQESKNGK